MKKKQSHLDQLKKDNPFKVPDGYMEGLTQQIMSQLPKKEPVEVKRITMTDRIRPWLYLAAVFAGLGLFFKAIIGISTSDGAGAAADSLLVHNTNMPYSSYVETYNEDEEYLEYIETQYANYLLAEEWDFYE
ncbi:hypothetical protein LJC57_09225 [Parabacteroides sp. OttesenSCG-928-G07]|nr:hypothetical protein [Parabacteroides sp. OttesenSCG-928-G21]MDL2278759.1 hypothetical protein [Parabacteroides sp. OttesenSCG-928-G07]